jgi:2-keto-4-pentenoate hydratase
MSKIENFAAQLAQAEATQVGIDPITVTDAEITVDEAYYIQLENIKKKLSEGQKIVGKKIGLTSVAVQKMLGVDEPDYGHLLDSMVVENGGTIDCKTMLQPKAVCKTGKSSYKIQ